MRPRGQASPRGRDELVQRAGRVCVVDQHQRAAVGQHQPVPPLGLLDRGQSLGGLLAGKPEVASREVGRGRVDSVDSTEQGNLEPEQAVTTGYIET